MATNVKREIICQLGDNTDLYGNFRTAREAMVIFKEKNPDLEFKEGYFNHFWNKIFLEGALVDEESEVYLAYRAYSAKPKKIATPVLSAVPQREPLVIRTVNTGTMLQDIPAAMFSTFLTNTVIDELHSEDGGAMAACSVVVVGGPGVGKSTLMFWSASRYRQNHPTAKIAVVSSEMEVEDLLYEAQRKPWMNEIEFILTSEYQETLKEALTLIFLGGYDIIILDSFADICDKLRDFCNMTTSAAETWLLDLMKKAKGGGNSAVKEEKVFTLTFAIQQQTKSGSFAGSNKLKHNTTGMLELRKEKNGDRYMIYTKNRRNGPLVGKRLFYFLGANNQVSFDIERWEREKMDGSHDAIGQQQEAIDQANLQQFDQLDAEAIQRAQAMLQQAEIATDANGNPVIPTIPQPAAQTAAAAQTEDLGEGMTEDDIYNDEMAGIWVLDFPSGRTITAPTKDEVIAQARSLGNTAAN
jgi:hypothetical protein